ncbi:MAG: gliding motility-associated C-terminal domain-containing protein [Flavobacteriales bacterium]|nr:gliding motility-associated C-terminal domain-containing protein [Flavobacteriales bacterium]
MSSRSTHSVVSFLAKKKILFSAICLTIASLSSSAQVTLGPDTVLCNGEPFTLSATVSAGLESTSYAITTIPFAPHPIAGSTVALTDDAVSSVLPIGFSFCFFGNNYTQFYIGSNGWISFSGGQTQAYTSSTIPSTGANVPKNCVMGPWQDWNPGVGGTIRYQTQGTAPFRRLVVTWDNVPMFSCTGNLGKFQIVCYETTSVVENHIWNKPNCTNWAGGTAVQGLHNLAGTQAFVVPGRNSTQWTTTNEARRYTPNGLNWYANGVLVGSDFSITIDPEVTTVYVATATLCSNAVSSDTLVVTVGLPLSFATSELTNTECTEATGSISVGIETDSEGPFTYLWADPLNVDGTEVSGLVEGLYTLTVTDDVTGCAIDTTFEIETDYQIFVFTQGSDINCADGNDGTATASASNGTGSYTYEWNDATEQTGQTASNLGVGTYTVTVTDEIGCTETAEVEIDAPEALGIAIEDSTFPLCNGDITGAATVDASGGIAGYIYSWSNGVDGPTITNVPAGQYIVDVVDANGCEGELQVNIIQPQPLNPNEEIQNPTCDGFMDGSIQLDPLGGTGPYEYLWVQSGNTSSLEQNLTVGSYDYVITDNNDCIYSGFLQLLPTAPMELIANTSDISCFGEDDGIGSADVTGGTPGYTYQWNDDQNQTGATATNLEPGNYTVVVTDAFGCQQTTNIQIAEPTELSASITSSSPALCNNSGGGSATVTTNGGILGYTYLWSNGETTAAANDLNGGSVIVTVTDANGCTDVASIVIDEPEVLEASLQGLNPECNGENSGSATASVQGGVAPYFYDWSNGNTGATANGLGAGTVTVSITDANGCEVLESINLTQPAAIQSNVSVDDASCGDNDGSASVGGTSGGDGPYTYSWTGTFQTGNSANNLTAGNYQVVITDSNGCTGIETFIVGETNFPNASMSASTVEGPQPLTVTFTNFSSNGSQYIWDFGDGGTENSNNLGAVNNTFQNDGNYEVMLVVISPGGCTDTTYLNIFVFSDSFLTLPNVFTPNTDGKNNTFKPLESGQLRNYKLIVYDRWGKEIFSTEDPTRGWTGKNEGGDDMAEGTYYYVVQATGFDGEKYDKSGHVTLLR